MSLHASAEAAHTEEQKPVASQSSRLFLAAEVRPQQQHLTVLDMAQLHAIEEQWHRFWSEAGFLTSQDRNRLLARRLREVTLGDPWALDMAKADGKDFL